MKRKTLRALMLSGQVMSLCAGVSLAGDVSAQAIYRCEQGGEVTYTDSLCACPVIRPSGDQPTSAASIPLAQHGAGLFFSEQAVTHRRLESLPGKFADTLRDPAYAADFKTYIYPLADMQHAELRSHGRPAWTTTFKV